MSQVQTRDPLKAIPNGQVTQSKLKPPTKVAVADHIEHDGDVAMKDKENVTAGMKRKSAEAELRENLRQRKLMNSTMTASTLSKQTVKRPVGRDLNQTLDSAAAAALVKKKPATELSKSTVSLRAAVKPVAKAAVSAPSKAAAKGRPAWDVKGRLEDSEKMQQQLKHDMSSTMTTVQRLQEQLAAREQQVATISEVKATLEHNVQGTTKELQQVYTEKLELQNHMLAMQNEHNTVVQDLMMKGKLVESNLQNTMAQLNMSKSESEGLKLTIQNQIGQIAAFTSEIEAVKLNLQTAIKLNQERMQKIESLELTLDEKNAIIGRLEAQSREDETMRKKLHNTIQELKGNIRVFCRIRPFLGGEVQEFSNPDSQCFEYPVGNDKAIDIAAPKTTSATGKSDESKKFGFSFDKVFQPGTSQESVFGEISQLVQSALDGYNTCIFAYGQTGSGKTYTMEGAGIQSELDMPICDNTSKGMIPRAVEQIYLTAESLKEKGWTYEMQAMFVEIYNENIRDLLASSKVNDETKYEIKHDNKGNTSITNTNVVKVRTPSQVYQLLQKASHNRAVGKTDMNERSSRSHSVFQLKLSGTNSITGEKNNGILNLIDLAGSERLNQSGVTGQRLKETQHINKSLTHLGDVISALANKDSHIPYRNSKLTYLLQNSLGGNSKTLMFVNISPRPTDLNETISSLRFATKVNACEIGTAKKQVKVDL